MTGSEWISWTEAAELVGCPVPTIDWHCRLGTIATRPRHGARPTVSRASVAEFAIWWRQREEERARRRAEREAKRAAKQPATWHERDFADRPEGWLSTSQAAQRAGVTAPTIRHWVRSGRLPAHVTPRGWAWIDPTVLDKLSAERGATPWRERDYVERPDGWLSSGEAAERAGVSAHTIRGWVRTGRLPAKISAGRWAWIDPAELDRFLVEHEREEGQWVTRAEAAELTGCSQWLIQAGIDRGLIETRRRAPALLRDSVFAYAKALQAEAGEWISVRTAIALTGIPQGTIIAALKDGRIRQRPGRGRRATLSRGSVEALAHSLSADTGDDSRTPVFG